MRTILFAALLTTGMALGCKKENDVSKVVDIAYPAIELKGDKYVSLHTGESYSDPGAHVSDPTNGSSADIMADYSSLDVNTPGLYYMQYSYTNSYGYTSNAGRYIAVTDYADAVDLSGSYERTANGVVVNLERVARGLYMTDDMGGAGLNDAGYFAVLDDSTIDFGPQLSESLGTEIYGVNGALQIGPDDTSYTYALRAPGYGTAQRVFVKVQ